MFNMLIDDGESTTGTVGGGDMDVVLDPKIRRLKLIQQEHERQLRNRVSVSNEYNDNSMAFDTLA